MDASYKIQRGIHVHLIQFFMCPEFWVHIRAQRGTIRFFFVFHPILSEQEEPGIILFLAKNL